jgi:hypothetical protein
MRVAYPRQKFQDWFTQQWAILWGKRIEPEAVPWLLGPFGSLGVIADTFIDRIAAEEGLVVDRNAALRGLIPSIRALNFSAADYARISPEVIRFYEETSLYQLEFAVRWNPLFKVFGKLLNCLFSNRLGQLNIPASQNESFGQVNSEIITLTNPKTGEVKYTVWYRTFNSTGRVLYSGVYTTCTLPSGEVCIKAVFPLPNGNATVIMSPSVGPGGELRLDASGREFGNAGFYFLLRDAKGAYWSQYIRAFRDQLVIRFEDGTLLAEQTLTLWNWRVLRFNYKIYRAA